MKHTIAACLLLVLTGCQFTGVPHGLAPIFTGHAAKSPVVGVRAILLPPTAAPEPPPGQIIDLPAALARAGVENPTIALAFEAIRVSQAHQLHAQALLLPTLDAGGSFNWHRGNLLSSQGVIIDVRRQSAYAGAGAAAVGAGTVGIPGVYLSAHLGDALFEPAAMRFQVQGRRLDAQATRNQVLLEVATSYFALAGAEARLKAQRQSEEDFTEIARLTANFAKAGQGREANANRAQAEATLQLAAAQGIEEEVAVAAAELARLLAADPGIRLRTPPGPVPLLQLVDAHDNLEDVIQIAMLNRPEIAARSADVAEIETRLRKEHVKPLLPVVAVGFSAGGFGGGSSTADTGFGSFRGRTDFDATAFWTLQNFGFGNLAVQHQLRAQVGAAIAERARAIDAIRAEVAEAFVQSAARRSEMEVALRRLSTAQRAFEEDTARARNLGGLPIELLNSARLLSTARQEHLRVLIAFNQAQLQLFVSLGQPPP